MHEVHVTVTSVPGWHCRDITGVSCVSNTFRIELLTFLFLKYHCKPKIKFEIKSQSFLHNFKYL